MYIAIHSYLYLLIVYASQLCIHIYTYMLSDVHILYIETHTCIHGYRE